MERGLYMKIGFYCRIGGRHSGCLLPDEKEKLQAFFAAAENEEREQLRSRKENCEK